MAWIELHITTSASKAPLLSEALSACGASAVTFHDGGNQPIDEPTQTTPRIWEQTIVIGLFEKADWQVDFETHFSAFGNEIAVKEVADTDWVRQSLDRFQPMRFGKRLWICPSWQTPVESEAVNVILDPGLAFGTGSHPTTALCLEWIEQNIIGGTVIDYGCGSGILGIAAYKLGASRVYAVDNDPEALAVARENAKQNGIQCADFITLSPGEALPATDFVIANILAGPLTELSEHLSSLTKPDGYLILSGILAEQAQNISKSYGLWYNMKHPVFKEEWALLEGIRANNN